MTQKEEEKEEREVAKLSSMYYTIPIFEELSIEEKASSRAIRQARH
jgi:hypothetical protein